MTVRQQCQRITNGTIYYESFSNSAIQPHQLSVIQRFVIQPEHLEWNLSNRTNILSQNFVLSFLHSVMIDAELLKVYYRKRKVMARRHSSPKKDK